MRSQSILIPSLGLGLTLAVSLLGGCADRRPPEEPQWTPVDFSGHWVLNQADSDDPQRILQSQFKAAVGKTSDTGGNGGDGSGGGRRGGRGSGRGGGSGGRQGGSQSGSSDSNDGGVSPIGRGPLPSMDLMSAAVRWPGKSLVITQSGETVTLNSDEATVECKRMSLSEKKPRTQKPSSGEHRRSATDADLKQFCGLTGKSLVLHTGNMDEDHPPFVERFKISADGSRLIELVGFGQRGGGFSLSRVWDKAADTAQTPTNPQAAP